MAVRLLVANSGGATPASFTDWAALWGRRPRSVLLNHLLIALTATSEDHHAIYFHLANSAVVVDESDFYDAFVQANLTILLNTLRLLDVPVLIMANRHSHPPSPHIFDSRADYHSSHGDRLRLWRSCKPPHQEHPRDTPAIPVGARSTFGRSAAPAA